jgi:predicted RNA binding protein YcfA (HicA-like mRNA interferase family)
MSRREKLIERFLAVPNDFTYDELVRLLGYYGFIEISTGKTSGSRVRFSNEKKQIINVHKPHPGNIVRTYVIKQILENLKKWQYID